MPDAVTVLEDLPEWLVVDEILLRLPPKDVLRCRAVRKSWRAATSTDKFILNHHRRQPSLPIFHRHNEGIFRLVAAGDHKIQQVLEYLTPTDPTAHIGVMHHAACDGLLLVSTNGPLIKHATFYSSNPATTFYICNPATRKCAPLLPPPLRPAFNKATVVAFYRHQASGEHRVLWLIDNHDASGAVVDPPGYFVLPVGSDQPRCVQWPTHLANFRAIRTNQVECPPVHHRGGLHWALHWAPGLGIKVFDTDTETFRQMSRPAQFHMVSLHHLGGDLALCGTSLECVTLDVWALQDYDAEIWGFLYRIDLRVVVASPPLDFGSIHVPSMAVVNGRELLIQHGRYRILHCDIEGLYLGEVEIKQYENSWDMFTKYLSLTRHRLQESLISLPLFEMQEEDAVHHKPPFTIVL